MKKGMFCAVALLMYISASSQGIEFEKSDWQSVLAKARQVNKPIFIDVYTTWCGPCRDMSNNIFPLEEVGDFFNQHFINYKLDAEKGEGIRLSANFEVDGYPTFLFIQPDGQMFYRSVGSMPVKHFLSLGQQALLDFNAPDGYLVLRKHYESNRSQIPAVQAYLEKRIEMNLTNSELLDEYLNLLSPEQQDSDSILDLLRWDKNSIKAGSVASIILIRNKDRMKDIMQWISMQFHGIFF
jgi:thioredoxin-related protein